MFPGIRVAVESADGQPVVVKSTETEEGMTRLATETDRLDRAAHPGVVEVLDRDEGRLVLAWAGGQTLASYRAPFPQLAAVLASLSATVADLHDLGIVHGAIQADHVVIGADGRPRLCGFGGPVGRADRAGPADDVAAMGGLITDLLGDEADIEPIPDRRWGRRRWSGYLRRALLTLADQATDTDAAHRPTARTLAASIADAVPDARIEPAPMPDPARAVPHTDRAAPEAANGSADRTTEGVDTPPGPGSGIGSKALAAEPDQPAPVAGTRADPGDAAQGDPDRDRTGSAAGTDETRGFDTAGPGADEVAAPAPATISKPPADASSSKVGDAPFLIVDHPAPASTASDADRGNRGPEDGHGSMEAEADRPIELLADREAEDDRESETSNELAGAPAVLGLRTVGSDPSESPHDSTVDRLRPSPSRNSSPTPSIRSWRTVATVGAAVAVLAALGLAVRPDGGGQALTTQAPADPAPSSAPAPSAPPPVADTTPPTVPSAEAGCVAVSGPVADVDGDGCEESVSIDATFIKAGRQTFEVGQAGDALSVGDWDCNGQVTPGLVRPGTGEVFLFASWPDDRAGITVDASTVVPDAERLEPRPTGAPCSPPTVVLSSGGRRSLDRPDS